MKVHWLHFVIFAGVSVVTSANAANVTVTVKNVANHNGSIRASICDRRPS
jgi:putative methionine-R-sulfoxide reductase with GAF domain